MWKTRTLSLMMWKHSKMSSLYWSPCLLNVSPENGQVKAKEAKLMKWSGHLVLSFCVPSASTWYCQLWLLMCAYSPVIGFWLARSVSCAFVRSWKLWSSFLPFLQIFEKSAQIWTEGFLHHLRRCWWHVEEKLKSLCKHQIQRVPHISCKGCWRCIWIVENHFWGKCDRHDPSSFAFSHTVHNGLIYLGWKDFLCSEWERDSRLNFLPECLAWLSAVGKGFDVGSQTFLSPYFSRVGRKFEALGFAKFAFWTKKLEAEHRLMCDAKIGSGWSAGKPNLHNASATAVVFLLVLPLLTEFTQYPPCNSASTKVSLSDTVLTKHPFKESWLVWTWSGSTETLLPGDTVTYLRQVQFYLRQTQVNGVLSLSFRGAQSENVYSRRVLVLGSGFFGWLRSLKVNMRGLCKGESKRSVDTRRTIKEPQWLVNSTCTVTMKFRWFFNRPSGLIHAGEETKESVQS